MPQEKSYTLYYAYPFDSTPLPDKYGYHDKIYQIYEQLDTPFETQCKIRFLSFGEANVSMGIADSTTSDSTKFVLANKPASIDQPYLSPYSLLFPGNKKIFLRGTFFDQDLGQYKTIDYLFKTTKLELGKVYTVVITGTFNDNDDIPLIATLAEEGTNNNTALTLDKITSNQNLLKSKAFIRFINGAANFSTYGPVLKFDKDFKPTYLFTTLSILFNTVPIDTTYYLKNFITYQAIDPGNYLLEITPTGYVGPDFIKQNVLLERGKGYDFFIKPGPANTGLQLQILENDNNVPADKFRLRAINSFEGMGNVDIKINDPSSTPIISNLPYSTASSYVDLPSSSVASRIFITTAGSNVDLFPAKTFYLPFTPSQSGTLFLKVAATPEPYSYTQSVADLGFPPVWVDPNPMSAPFDINWQRQQSTIMYYSDDGSNKTIALKRPFF